MDHHVRFGRLEGQADSTCLELKGCKFGSETPPPMPCPKHTDSMLQVRKSCPQPISPRSRHTRKFNSINDLPFENTSPSLLVVASLERGILVNLYSHKKKTECMTLCLWRNIGELVFVRSMSSKAFITVKLDEVKEICRDSRQRLIRNSEDLPALVDPIITIMYGSGFMMKSVSFSPQKNSADGGINFEMMCLGIEETVKEHRQENFYEQRQKWIHREIHKLRTIDVASQNTKETKISLKHVQAWFRQHSLQTSKQFLILTQTKLKLPDHLDTTDFSILVSNILITNLVDQILKEYGTPSPDGKRFLTKESFRAFLIKEQKESDVSAIDILGKMLECFPRHYASNDLVFSKPQFEHYLFSGANPILNPGEKSVNQDMDRSLSHYWIASSHNTYLTGDQWKGDSSVETYARCLRMGCRCLELDCWDGPDGKPIITHGKTLTSKIRVSDVLHTIKEHAWVVTDYPLVLSIENHCCLAQQRVLASLFKEVFQDELLMEQVDPNETCLPSPNQLKRKIIIKNKKLQRDGKILEARGGVEGMDLMDIKKYGAICLKYATEKNWHDFEFVLGESHLCFSPKVEEEEEETEEEMMSDYFDGYESDEEMTEHEMELNSQLWYHGCIGRKAAEEAILENRSHGDGSFLVRESVKGGYALSFLYQNSIMHSIIKPRQEEDGTVSFLLANEIWHKNILELVEFYKTHLLTFRGKTVQIYLTFPIWMKLSFKDERWYFPDMDRVSAESLLRRIQVKGVFLVRKSSVDNSFSLSFRHNKAISHFQIEYVNKKFTLSNFRFSKMESLISFFQKHPLYRTVRLCVPASYDLVSGSDYQDVQLYEESYYTNPQEAQSYEDILYTNPEEAKTVTGRALYDFHASAPDELSFKRGSYITNILIVDQPWWKGDHDGERQKLFPANYVHLIDEAIDEEELGKPTEAALHLAQCYIEYNIQLKDRLHYFLLTHSSQPSTLMVGSTSLSELTELLALIQDTVDKITSETQELQKEERSKNIAQELSDLIVYCQAVPYNPSRQGKFCEISSFSEERVGKEDPALIEYNHNQLARVYPKFLRVSSTNYDPIPKWNVGCHMLALNYQTPDRPMQLNQARFLQNGGCGYVLKPDFMRSPTYSPACIRSLTGTVEPIVMTITVLGGRNLDAGGAAGTGIAVSRPFVVVEVLGLPLDNQRERTRISSCNTSLNPVWKHDVFVFHISCPELAFLRFEVFSEHNETTFLSQTTLPLPCIQQGYRSVQLKNGFSENLPLSTLLVHINIKNPKEEEEKSLFLIMEETRRLYNELSTSDNHQDEQKRVQLQQTERKLLQYLDQSKNHGHRRTWVC